jgi:hypothetical protein
MFIHKEDQILIQMRGNLREAEINLIKVNLYLLNKYDI